MNSICDFKKISFREIEQASFRIACKTQIEEMRVFIKDFDDEICKIPDRTGYESLGQREWTVTLY